MHMFDSKLARSREEGITDIQMTGSTTDLTDLEVTQAQ